MKLVEFQADKTIIAINPNDVSTVSPEKGDKTKIPCLMCLRSDIEGKFVMKIYELYDQVVKKINEAF